MSDQTTLPAFYPPSWINPREKTLAGQPHDQWQSYSPPSADNPDTYAYPQPGGQGYPEAQGYPGAQDYAAARDQPPWQPGPDTQAQPQARARAAADAKGFFGSLFDFSFSSFVTPKIIKVLYVLYTIWVIVWAVIFLRLGFKYGGATGGFFTLLVIDPIFLLLTLGAYRVVLELFMVIHRMHDDLKAIRRQGDERG